MWVCVCVHACVCGDNRVACSCCKGEVGHHQAWMMRSHLNQVNHCLLKGGVCYYLYSKVRVRRRLYCIVGSVNTNAPSSINKKNCQGVAHNLLINYQHGSIQTRPQRSEMCLELIYVWCLPLTHQTESRGEMSRHMKSRRGKK